jgi:pilus assembly protein CpaB
MIRRIIIGALALVLAVVGGVMTFSYASGADQRAIAELAPTRVLVVAAPIPAGTPSSAIAESLVVDEIPAAAVVPGALTDLSSLEGQQTTTDLVPGEQLLPSRFASPDALPGAVEIPPGMHQLTVQLDARRVLGGEVHSGDRVGVFVSRADGAIAETQLILHKVLVTAVRGGPSVTEDEEGNEVEQGPSDILMVTMALSAPDAELVVFAAEYELMYLSLEPDDASEEGTRSVTPEVILP